MYDINIFLKSIKSDKLIFAFDLPPVTIRALNWVEADTNSNTHFLILHPFDA